MSIKNKDGSVYKLRGPNPLLMDQIEWDKAHVRLINVTWKSEIVNDARNPIEASKINIVNIRDELGLKDNPKTKIVPAKDFLKEAQAPIETSELKTPETVLNVDSKLARILRERGVEFFCIPVVNYEKITDELYDNSYMNPIYGEKYLFDALIIDQSDLQLQYWCVLPMLKNSIVLRKNKEGGERWWRILAVEEKTGGYLVICNISDVNPDFS